MLDSKAVGSIKKELDNRYYIYIRTNYAENLRLWAFQKCNVTFDNELKAKLYFVKRYPLAKIVDFSQLTTFIP